MLQVGVKLLPGFHFRKIITFIVKEEYFLLGCVVWCKSTDISEEYITTIFGVKEKTFTERHGVTAQKIIPFIVIIV
jgi:hypothetical protein